MVTLLRTAKVFSIVVHHFYISSNNVEVPIPHILANTILLITAMLVDMKLESHCDFDWHFFFLHLLDLMHRGHLTKIRDSRRRPEDELQSHLRLNKGKRVLGFLS